MTSLRHPYITPPLVIEVEDESVPDFVEAGWLRHEEPSTDDLADPGADD